MMSITWPLIGKAIIETLQMVSISLLIGSLIAFKVSDSAIKPPI